MRPKDCWESQQRSLHCAVAKKLGVGSTGEWEEQGLLTECVVSSSLIFWWFMSTDISTLSSFF